MFVDTLTYLITVEDGINEDEEGRQIFFLLDQKCEEGGPLFLLHEKVCGGDRKSGNTINETPRLLGRLEYFFSQVFLGKYLLVRF